MGLNAGLLRRLAALKLTGETYAEIIAIIADIQADDESRLQKQRDRTARSRYKSRHGNATDTLQERDCNSDSPPVHILSPLKNSEPKKVLRSIGIEQNWTPSVTNQQFAIDAGLTTAEIEHEAARFRDHFMASGARKRDWDATWRNWIRSPYRQKAHINGQSNDPFERRRGESLGGLAGRLADAARDLEAREIPGRTDDGLAGD